MIAKRKKKKPLWRRIRKRTRPARHLFIYSLARGAGIIFNSLPIDFGIALGGRIGCVAYYLMWWLRRKAHENLKLIYGNHYDEKKRRQIARDVFINAGRGIVEALTLQRWSRDRLLERIEFKGDERLYKQREKGEAVVVITAHIGNWEMAAFYSRNVWQVESVAVAREMSNPYFDRWILNWRKSFGMEILQRGQAGIELFRKARQGKNILMLVDQNIDGAGVDLPFLGRPAHTFLGPAIIVQRLNARLLSAFFCRKPGGKYVFELNEIDLSHLKGLSKEEQVEGIARVMNDACSACIDKYPEQWMWFHDRWRKHKVKK